MAILNGYATLAQFRVHMGDTGTTLNTDLAERAIESASRAIDRYCGRRFWIDSTVQDHYYRATDAYTLWLDEGGDGAGDIATTTGLVIATDTTGDGTFATTWASTDYELLPLNSAQGDTTAYSWTHIEAVDRYTFPVGARRKSVKVTAKFGWSAVPEDVEEACLIKASSLFERRKAPMGMFSGLGDFGVVRINRFDPDVASLLDPYVKVGVGAV